MRVPRVESMLLVPAGRQQECGRGEGSWVLLRALHPLSCGNSSGPCLPSTRRSPCLHLFVLPSGCLCVVGTHSSLELQEGTALGPHSQPQPLGYAACAR